MKQFFWLLFSFISITWFSCTPNRKLSDNNLNLQYKRSQQNLHPDFRIHHTSDTTSTLHFRIKTLELTYQKEKESNKAEARIRIKYELRPSYDSKQTLDSSSAIIIDSLVYGTEYVIGSLPFKSRLGNNYLLEITLTDLTTNLSSKHFLSVFKDNKHSSQYFQILSYKSNQPYFKNYFTEPDSVSIVADNPDASTLFVRYYKRKFPLAAPPFSDVNHKPFVYKADSNFILNKNDFSNFTLTFPREGIYHIQSDTSTKEGLTLYRFHEDYPVVSKPELLVPPLRFITSKDEFETLINNQNKKAAVDKFWLDIAGNPSRARQLLKTFYNRVQDANILFASYVEGWKTDRGLIYLIYGAPNALYRSNSSETWVYGEERNSKSLTFTFVKVINPFTDNDYSLNRNELYKDSWYNAVDMWRQGRIFTD